ncbi:hypothetical protein [Streptomyces sp. NPDC050504]|uniref:hypothetical protein n=1 Tax=Streptomyces sp. NPDC050504 TaxID=3365618 RepID=UPI0037A2A4F5
METLTHASTPGEAPPPTAAPESRRGRWPHRVPHAAAVWGLLCALTQGGWAVTGTAVPWRPDAPYPADIQVCYAALALLAAGAAASVPHPRSPGGRGAVTAGLVLTLAVCAVNVIGLPAYLVTLLSGGGVESATGLAHVALYSAGACLVLPTLLVHRRRGLGRCPRCGAAHQGTGTGALIHPERADAPRGTLVAAYALLCGLLPWSAVKTWWTLGGDALGVTAEEWAASGERGSDAARSLASAGVDVTVLAAALGVFLALGLVHRWGAVFPRWTLPLSGTRVPRLLPLVPAWLVGVPLAAYGTLLTIGAALSATGAIPAFEAQEGFSPAGLTWMVLFGGLAFGGLGGSLLVGARSYAARTRPVCAAANSPAEKAR